MTLLPPSFHFYSPTCSSSSSSSSTSSPLPPATSNLIITDTPQSPADFLIYSLLSSSIRRPSPTIPPNDVLMVDFQARGRGHYESVGKKIGTPLPPKSTSGSSGTGSSSASSSSSSSFEYYAPGPSDLFPSDQADPTSRGSLKTLFDRITKTLAFNPPTTRDNDEQDRRGRVIFLVGFSELGWQGFEAEELARFHRALMGFVRQSQSTLITHLHAPLLLSPQSTADHLSSSSFTGEEEVELSLLLRLLRAGSGGTGAGTIWWRVEELKSGRSGVVHGEISIHPLSPAATRIQQRVPHQNPLQYRLDDTAVRVFPKGTGRGYL